MKKLDEEGRGEDVSKEVWTFEEEVQLVKALHDKDEKALVKISKDVGNLLKQIINGVVLNNEDVDDLYSAALLEIWTKIDQFDAEKGRLIGWVVTLVRRRAIDGLRRKGGYWRMKERFQALVMIEEKVFSSSADFEIKNPDYERVHELLYHVGIPEEQREALLFCYVEGMSQRQIAAYTGIPLGTIKTRLELGFRKISALIRADPALAGDAVL